MDKYSDFLRDWISTFRKDRVTVDVHYMAKQLYRVIIGRGSTAVTVRSDFSSAFDSMSHIYLFNALKRADASAKALYLLKVIHSHVMVMTRVNDELSAPFRIGRGQLEGDITSPIYFNIGLEQIFRYADELNLNHTPLDGVMVRDVTVDKVGFADDVTLLSSDAERHSTTVSNV